MARRLCVKEENENEVLLNSSSNAVYSFSTFTFLLSSHYMCALHVLADVSPCWLTLSIAASPSQVWDTISPSAWRSHPGRGPL